MFTYDLPSGETVLFTWADDMIDVVDVVTCENPF